MKNLFTAAHKMTKEMVNKYGDIDYSAQFILCLNYLIELNSNKGVTRDEMINELLKKDIPNTRINVIVINDKFYFDNGINDYSGHDNCDFCPLGGTESGSSHRVFNC